MKQVKTNMKQVKTPDDVPSGEHYAVIEFRKVTEASGQGSGENDTQVLCPHYYVTEDRADWTAHVKKLELEKVRPYEACPYVALHVKSKAAITTEISLT